MAYRKRLINKVCFSLDAHRVSTFVLTMQRYNIFHLLSQKQLDKLDKLEKLDKLYLTDTLAGIAPATTSGGCPCAASPSARMPERSTAPATAPSHPKNPRIL